ncbi:hypothetical protein D3C78_1616060 [compost metagenome]
MDHVDRLLASLRATPLLWLLSQRMQATNVFGWYGSFEILIQYANYSECSIDLEGLT